MRLRTAECLTELLVRFSGQGSLFRRSDLSFGESLWSRQMGNRRGEGAYLFDNGVKSGDGGPRNTARCCDAAIDGVFEKLTGGDGVDGMNGAVGWNKSTM